MLSNLSWSWSNVFLNFCVGVFSPYMGGVHTWRLVVVMCGVQRCGSTRSCVIYWSWAGEERAVVSDHGAENTVGLISYLVSHKPGILTQVCSPLMPHLGSEHRISSLGGHPLLASRSVEWFDSAVSDLKLTCCSLAHLLLTCCSLAALDQGLKRPILATRLDLLWSLGFPGAVNTLLSHAKLIAFSDVANRYGFLWLRGGFSTYFTCHSPPVNG